MWKLSLKMPHVWWHMTPDKKFSAIRVYKLSFLFLLLEYHFLKLYWGFIVVVWSLSLWRTSLFPSLSGQTIKPYFQQGKYLTSCFSHQPAAENWTVLLHFAHEIWHCTAYIPSRYIAKYWSKTQSWWINLMPRALKI